MSNEPLIALKREFAEAQEGYDRASEEMMVFSERMTSLRNQIDESYDEGLRVNTWNFLTASSGGFGRPRPKLVNVGVPRKPTLLSIRSYGSEFHYHTLQEPEFEYILKNLDDLKIDISEWEDV